MPKLTLSATLIVSGSLAYSSTVQGTVIYIDKDFMPGFFGVSNSPCCNIQGRCDKAFERWYAFTGVCSWYHNEMGGIQRDAR